MTPGSTATVSVTTGAGTSNTTTTAMTTATPQGAVTGYQGLCLDDRGASTAEYNPVQVYTCNNTNAQQWTVESNGSLQALGM